MIYSKDDEEIVTLEQQEIIVNWVRLNYKYFKINGYHRYFQQLDCFDDVPECIWDIKKQIMDKEDLYSYDQEPLFRDSIGYMLDDGDLHLHTDPNPPNTDLIHTRFNVYVKLPEKGGYPIYANNHYRLKERTYICCRAGMDFHCCAKVENGERVVISFGFLIPKSRVENIIYNY